jgi:hypothetical protein
MLLSAVLGLGGVLIYYRTGDHYAGDDIAIFDETNLGLASGQGVKDENGLIIRALDEQGVAIVSSQKIRLDGGRFNELNWHIDGLDEQTSLQLIWTTRAAPRQLQQLEIPHRGASEGQLLLHQTGNWQGFIGALGLRLEKQGSLSGEITIQRLTLKPMTPDIRSLLSGMLSEWRFFESWNDHSINFLVGGPRQDALLRPLPAIAVWLLLSIAVYRMLRRNQRRHDLLSGAAVIFMLGWLVLDVRWQWSLWQQNHISYELYAGKSPRQKKLVQSDAELFRFAQAVKRHLPEQPARVFLVNPDPHGTSRSSRLRMHYHLLPHNVYSGIASIPDPDKTDEGDYLVILKPITGLNYSQEQHRLIAARQKISLAARLLYSADLGYVFRVEE